MLKGDAVLKAKGRLARAESKRVSANTLANQRLYFTLLGLAEGGAARSLLNLNTGDDCDLIGVLLTLALREGDLLTLALRDSVGEEEGLLLGRLETDKDLVARVVREFVGDTDADLEADMDGVYEGDADKERGEMDAVMDIDDVELTEVRLEGVSVLVLM